MSFWRSQARKRIAELVAGLPVDATLEQRRKALRGQGWSGGWAQKAWVKEVRSYLEQHGAAPRPGKSFRFPEHIHFPFREGSDAQG